MISEQSSKYSDSHKSHASKQSSNSSGSKIPHVPRFNIDNLSKKEMKKMLMQVINENRGEKETDSVIELKKLRNTIPKTVKLR